MGKRGFAVIQARMGSTRLPGKVLKDLCGEPMLSHIIRRVKQAPGIGKILIATSVSTEDAAIEVFANSVGIPCFRGSEGDVLDRFFCAAKAFGAGEDDAIMRLTADNPLVDPAVLGELLAYFEASPYSYAAASGYPLGLGAEVFNFRALEEASRLAQKPYEREHVTPYMYRDPDKVGRLISPVNRSQYRFTVDTPEDFAFAETVYRALYHGKHNFYLEDILTFLAKNPEVGEINQNVRQKRLGE